MKIQKIQESVTLNSPALVLSQGKWQQFYEKQDHYENLNKFTGMLYLQDNNQHKILFHIIDIKFENLMKLSLQSNNIQSIQQISQLFAPKLVELQLGDNKLTKIKSLRKCYFENLKDLSLRKNNIIQLHYMQQFFGIIRNAFFQWFNDNANCSDVSWCLKLQTFQLKSLLLQSRGRLIQNKVFKQIKKKYPRCKLSYNKKVMIEIIYQI